jgi:hypothetical protein
MKSPNTPSGNSELTSLDLSSNCIFGKSAGYAAVNTPDDVCLVATGFASGLKCTAITHLNLCGNNIDARVMKIIAPGFHDLRTLDVSVNDFGAEGITFLAEGIKVVVCDCVHLCHHFRNHHCFHRTWIP